MPDFIEQQIAFAANIRAPKIHEIPEGIPPRRMELYQELLFNNINSVLSTAFPVLRRIFDDKQWYPLVRDFFANHKATSPIFHHIPEEFLRYLQYIRKNNEDPPWLYELAHYEWVETALALSQIELDDINCDTHGDLMSGIPVVSPLAWVQLYAYPVQAISEHNLPDTKPSTPTYLVVYRNHDYHVKFMHVNDFSYALLLLLSDEHNTLTGCEALNQLIRLTNHPNPAMVIDGGAQTLEQLRSLAIILGTKSL